jgi:hypothetical protein
MHRMKIARFENGTRGFDIGKASNKMNAEFDRSCLGPGG